MSDLLMSKKGIKILNNGRGTCPLWDGACDMGHSCKSKCKRKHKKLSNKNRRKWDKNIIKKVD